MSIRMDGALGDTLRRLRRDKQLTILQLAAKLEVSSAYISQVERNLAIPSEGRIKQLAKELDADPEVLSLLAGRIPKDVLHSLQHNPELLKVLRT